MGYDDWKTTPPDPEEGCPDCGFDPCECHCVRREPGDHPSEYGEDPDERDALREELAARDATIRDLRDRAAAAEAGRDRLRKALERVPTTQIRSNTTDGRAFARCLGCGMPCDRCRAAHHDCWARDVVHALLALATPEPPTTTEPAETCSMAADPCPEHGYVHGAEAEELRAGIERLICGERPTTGDLQRLLDRVDARDSLAYLEHAPTTTEPPAALADDDECVACGHTWRRHKTPGTECSWCECPHFITDGDAFQVCIECGRCLPYDVGAPQPCPKCTAPTTTEPSDGA